MFDITPMKTTHDNKNYTGRKFKWIVHEMRIYVIDFNKLNWINYILYMILNTKLYVNIFLTTASAQFDDKAVPCLGWYNFTYFVLIFKYNYCSFFKWIIVCWNASLNDLQTSSNPSVFWMAISTQIKKFIVWISTQHFFETIFILFNFLLFCYILINIHCIDQFNIMYIWKLSPCYPSD